MIDPLPIVPIEGPLDADVALPGSKSITNRALVCAALSSGRSVLRGALIADDTRAMVGALRTLGCAISIDGTTMAVEGCGGRFPHGDVTVDAALSGTTSRFVMALAPLAAGSITIDGDPPLRERPMVDGVDALRASGIEIESSSGRLPMVIHPAPAIRSPATRSPTTVSVSGSTSSQFLSGLLMAAGGAGDAREIVVDGALRSPDYVAMTLDVMGCFGVRVEHDRASGTFRVPGGGYVATDIDIEPDASAASYAMGAAAVVGGRVRIAGLGTSSIQGDVGFADVLETMGVTVLRESHSFEIVGTGRLKGIDVDMGAISDTAQTLACMAPFADGAVRISGIGFIRAKETDRVAGVVRELQRIGVDASEFDDGLEVRPSLPVGGTVRTYDDHRMAMSFALIGLRCAGIFIEDPSCVSKTFPAYWDFLDDLRKSAA